MLPRPLAVTTARDLGPQFVDNPHQMVGQDGAYSIPLNASESLWYFGDTLIGERPDRSLFSIFREVVDGKVEIGPGPFKQMITNTGLVLPHQSARRGLSDFAHILDDDGRLKKLVPSLPEEEPERQRVWCMHGLALKDRIYLGYMLIVMHETLESPDAIGFEVVGSGLAVGTRDDWSFRRLGGGPALAGYADTIWWDVTQPQFGAAIVHEPGDPHVYFFGSLQDARHPVQQAYLARVPVTGIEQLSRYEYFDGHAWSPDVRQAAPLFSGQPNELSISYNPHLQGFLAVHSWSLTGEIVGRTAPALWGPWSDPVVLWSPPESARAVPEGHPPRAFYAGKEHPVLAEEAGRVIFCTYVDNFEYFPHLIEVQLQ